MIIIREEVDSNLRTRVDVEVFGGRGPWKELDGGNLGGVAGRKVV